MQEVAEVPSAASFCVAQKMQGHVHSSGKETNGGQAVTLLLLSCMQAMLAKPAPPALPAAGYQLAIWGH
jgi:hypothetical protein